MKNKKEKYICTPYLNDDIPEWLGPAFVVLLIAFAIFELVTGI